MSGRDLSPKSRRRRHRTGFYPGGSGRSGHASDPRFPSPVPPLPSLGRMNNNGPKSEDAIRALFTRKSKAGITSKFLECEVNRLVEVTRAYCDREKFKLKEVYEEELVRKQRGLLTEFRCAMEQEVIGPLKQRLCESERENLRMREELDKLKQGEDYNYRVRSESLQERNIQLGMELEEVRRGKRLDALMEQEEKRSLLEEIEKSQRKLSQLEEENGEENKWMEELADKYNEVSDKLAYERKENERLAKELAEVVTDLLREGREFEELQRQLQEREARLEVLEGQLQDRDARKEEVDLLKAQLEESEKAKEEAQERMEANTEKLEQLQQKLAEEEEAMRKQVKKCEEECSLLSKKGQCVLHHEKKSMALANQLEEDNKALKDRLLQLELQLEEMAEMEGRSRKMHREMEELKERAMERGKKLEEIQELGCELPSPMASTPNFSLPNLPVPSDEE